jgi:hypothetical protein
MARDGYIVSGFDGRAPQQQRQILPQPFSIRGVRPDAWGQRADGAEFAFAEAKTVDDIDTAHSRHQLRILGNVNVRGKETACPLYIAVPRSGVYKLDRVLIDAGLLRARHVVRLHIPDVLLENAAYGSSEDARNSA